MNVTAIRLKKLEGRRRRDGPDGKSQLDSPELI